MIERLGRHWELRPVRVSRAVDERPPLDLKGHRGMRIRRVAALVAVVAFAFAIAPLSAQRNNDNNKRPQRSKAEQADLEALVRMVDGVSGGVQQAPADVPITWEGNHFVKGQDGITYLPFTLNVDRTKLSKSDVAFYVRVVNKTPAAPAPAAAEAKGDQKNQPPPRPTYPWDNLTFIEIPANGKLSRAIALKPGEYEAFISIKEKGTEKQERNAPPAKMGLLRKDLTVPDFNVPELTTSSILVASNIEVLNAPLPPAQQEMNPYVFGPMKIGLSPDGKFSKSGELNLVFWIYGAAAAQAGKPDVQIEYAFHQKLAEGEKYFNRTQPQTLNAQSLPPEFDVNAGHQLPGTLTVPLSSFPSGDYRLEIKVTDKTNNKSVTQNVTFTVLPA
jgi:hypothetical protein